MDLAGANVLLTGATGGIGRAVAAELHRRGAALVLSGRSQEALEGLAAELGDRVRVVEAELADRDAPAELAERAGRVDVLVANAALPGTGRLEDFEPGQIDRALDVNLRAPIQLARAFLPGMLERRRGHLTFVSSLSGKVPSPRASLYAATKFGLRGFAGALRIDLHGTGVGVTTIFPGFVREAGMFAASGAQLPPGVGSRTAEEVAEALIRGIERNRGEVDVAPLSLRVGALAANVAPGFSGHVQRRFGAGVAEGLARGNRDKR